MCTYSAVYVYNCLYVNLYVYIFILFMVYTDT